MPTLSEVVADPQKRRRVIDDGAALIDAEVDRKSGLSGLAVKAGFKVVKGVKPGIIPQALHMFLDDFARKVDPFWASFLATGEKDPKPFFVRNGPQIADALLSITDTRAAQSSHRTLKGAYSKLRGEARKHVMDAMPGVAELVRKHVG
jgi:hypothetical protein